MIGSGIFMWNGPERRTDRYGAFYMCDLNFDNTVRCEPKFDREAVEALLGKKVRITCQVKESRTSGHAGDDFLGIKPSTPQVGEVIELGVGILFMEEDQHSPCGVTVGVQPSDGRRKFWMDPRQLFKLHDQTVDLFIEETDQPETPDPSPELKYARSGILSNGDGTFQAKCSPEDEGKPIRILPKVEKIGDGLFLFRMPSARGNKGERFDIGGEG